MVENRTGRKELRRAEVADQLRALGVEKGGVLLVHTSFRAVRPVEGGPLGLIEALRDTLRADGTLVMPSWSGNDDAPFDARRTPASPDLGVVADMFWRLPGVLRSNHVHAFAAAGPEAARITADPLPLPPQIPESPAGRVHDLDGQVLLLGSNMMPTRRFIWRNSSQVFRTGCRSTARFSRMGTRFGSITGRMTIAARASPWRMRGCGAWGSSPKGAWDTPMHGLRAHGISSALRSST